MRRLTWFFTLALLLSGCASSLTGYGAKSELTCKASDGLPCTSLSRVYELSSTGGLDQALEQVQQMHRQGPGNEQPKPVDPPGFPAVPIALNNQTTEEQVMPIRIPPTVLRIWFAPWQDSQDVLFDQSFAYVTVDAGGWAIEHNQQAIQQRFAPTRLGQSAARTPANPAQINTTK